MKNLLDRVRNYWEALNERERRMFGALAALFAAFVLGFPLFLAARQNAELEEQNAEIRRVLSLIAEQRPRLQQLAEARRTSAARYRQKTPPLGSFLETEANKYSLAIREVTDQPEKSSGNFHRRSVTASIQEVDLTNMMNLLSGIVSGTYPVAIEHLQIEHYQPGDKYRFKLGVLTFDRKEVAEKPQDAAAAKQSTGGG